MCKNEVYPDIPVGTKCKNAQCAKPINRTADYVHLHRTEQTNSDTGKHEFFCNTQCQLDYEKQERMIAATNNHSSIRYLEYA